MRALKISEFKAKCLAVVEQVDRTGEPVTILKRGRAVARLVPAASGHRYPQDSLAGSVEIIGDILSPVLPVQAWEAARPARRRTRR
jgi:prevent-host-death family protein